MIFHLPFFTKYHKKNWRGWEAEWTRLVRHQTQHHLPPSKDIRPVHHPLHLLLLSMQSKLHMPGFWSSRRTRSLSCVAIFTRSEAIFVTCAACNIVLSRLETYWRPGGVRQLAFMCNNPASPFQTEYSAKDCLLRSWNHIGEVRMAFCTHPDLPLHPIR